MYSFVKINLLINKTAKMLLLPAVLLLAGCDRFLDEKPSKNLSVPSTPDDLQAILDNNNAMNTFYTGVGEASADNYYLADATWSSLDEASRNTYLWEKEIVFDSFINPWQNLYIPVYRSNTVLEGLTGVSRTSQNAQGWDNIKGSALFFRARSFLILVTTWAKAYDPASSSSDPGIPLRLDADFNKVSVRNDVESCYRQVVADLQAAVPLLPVTPVHVMRPSRPAAYALLSRTFLAMRQYEQAESYADSCLQLFSTLLDYKDLNAAASYPVPAFNKEVIFNANGAISMIGVSRAKIDPSLYQSYAANDLRRTVFFLKNTDNSYRFKGSYFGSSSYFTGIAADEVYLAKAECLARRGAVTAAIQVLNQLLRVRYDSSFVPFTAATAESALTLILTERRKELLMRDIRWMDLKRLNKEEGHETTIRRNLNGQVYELKPNENRYALPIPAAVIDMTGMEQNPR